MNGAVEHSGELDVLWHDAECGRYDADLPVWRRLVGEADGPVLDIGAGTGRVSLDLAAVGDPVTALDLDGGLLRALGDRAAARGLQVRTVTQDATVLDIPGERFAAIIVPMQTLQLLPDAAARGRLMLRARRHLRPGGLLACAVVTELEPFDPSTALLPRPDVLVDGDRRLVSQPVAIEATDGGARIRRIRQVFDREVPQPPQENTIELQLVSVDGLHEEGRRAGLQPDGHIAIPATEEHVGSEVVLLRV